MVETYNGKSPRNARIKIDYTGESPSVQFKYPRKDGYVGSMSQYIYVGWFLLCLLFLYLGGLGAVIMVAFDDDPLNITSNETIENNTEVQETESDKIIFLSGIKLVKKLINVSIVLLILFLPPFIIIKLFKKKLDDFYPIFMAWKGKKKYVEFKNKDIKVTEINSKKEIYVEIPYFENVILKYDGTKDFSKYLDIMKIEEQNFKTEKYDEKKKKKRKVKNEWYWNAKFYFNKIPETGSLKVVFK